MPIQSSADVFSISSICSQNQLKSNNTTGANTMKPNRFIAKFSKNICILYMSEQDIVKSFLKKDENKSKNTTEFSGAGRETSTGVPKLSQIFVAKLLTTPTNSVILLITLLYPAKTRITFALDYP